MLLVQQITNGLMLGGIYVLIAVAFTLAIGILNFLNFSVPGIFMLGAVITWRLLEAGWSWIPSIAAGLAVGVVASLVVERFTYRLMKGSDHEIPLVSSVGFLILFENLVVIGIGSDQQQFPQIVADFNIRIGELILGIGQLMSLGTAVVLVVAVTYLMNKTQIGRGIRAIGESAETATILGVQVHRIVPVLFIVTGLLTALAGLLFAINYQQVSWSMGEEVGLKGIAAMVIGGMGNISGAVIGGLLIGLTEVLSIYFLGANMVDISVYGLLLVLLVFWPQGILGSTSAPREKL